MNRDLEEKDIASCLAIYNHYIENTCYTLEEEKLSLEAFSSRVKAIKSRYPFIVYENERKEVIGYAYLDSFCERSAYRHTADLSIYVSKDHLHEHIGQALLEEIERKGKEYGITDIISIVTSENPTSLRFHLNNGFLLEGTLVNVAYKMSKDISVYYLHKKIGE